MTRPVSRGTLINWLINYHGYESYVEIGVDDVELNFNVVECKRKVGVEPNLAVPLHLHVIRCSSDMFFADAKEKGTTFDLIFIDGDHRCRQAIQDIGNALNCLTPGGTIVVHDCNPENEDAQHDDIVTGTWLGGVWRAWAMYRTWACLEMCVVRFDQGCGVIRPSGRQEPWPLTAHWEGAICETPYKLLASHREELLNLMTIDEFLKRYPNVASTPSDSNSNDS